MSWLNWIGGFTVLGVSVLSIAAAVWAVLRKVLEQWATSIFDRQKKVFEHEQAKELQHLKAKIDTLFQGSLKAQEREFEMIPKSLELSGEAYSLAVWLTAPLQEVYLPSQMNDAELSEFLDGQEGLPESQKLRVKQFSGRQRDNIWRELDHRLRINRVRRKLAEANSYIKANGLFIPLNLLERMERLHKVLHESIVTFQTGIQADSDPKLMLAAWQNLQDSAEPLHAELRTLARARLAEHVQP